MRRKLVRRLTQSRAFQNILGTGGAYYLRLVWATSQVITEPPNIYEAIDPYLPLHLRDVPRPTFPGAAGATEPSQPPCQGLDLAPP